MWIAERGRVVSLHKGRHTDAHTHALELTVYYTVCCATLSHSLSRTPASTTNVFCRCAWGCFEYAYAARVFNSLAHSSAIYGRDLRGEGLGWPHRHCRWRQAMLFFLISFGDDSKSHSQGESEIDPFLCVN